MTRRGTRPAPVRPIRQRRLPPQAASAPLSSGPGLRPRRTGLAGAFASAGLRPRPIFFASEERRIGVVRRHHRVVGRQAPTSRGTASGRHVVGRPKVPLQHLQLLAVLQTDDELGKHRTPHRYRGLRLLRFGRGTPGLGQRLVDGLDQRRQGVRRYRIVRDMRRNNLRRQVKDMLGKVVFARLCLLFSSATNIQLGTIGDNTLGLDARLAQCGNAGHPASGEWLSSPFACFSGRGKTIIVEL